MFHPVVQRVRVLNAHLAEAVTRGVGTMACAYVFTALSLVSLPGAIKTHDVVVIVGWIAQTFLQLVLLSILMVGQKAGNDWLASTMRETHDAVLGEVAGVAELVADLHAKHDATAVKVDALHEQITD